MSVETAERLKRELTDKYVVVMDGVPELRRFRGLTGTVKTVNMNGRALVQFDGPEDIGWYDIDPSYLDVIDKPLPKKKAVSHETAPAPKASAEKPAPKKPAGMSPLELARQQGAAKAGAAAPEKPAPATGEKKLSPLELARQQGAAKHTKQDRAAPAEKTAAEKKPASAAPTGAASGDGKQLSPLELARQQGAAKRDAGPGEPVSETETASAAKTSAATAVAEPEMPARPASSPADTAGLSKVELARLQGPAKR